MITCAKRVTFYDRPFPRTFAHMPIIRDIIYGAAARGADVGSLCDKAGISIAALNDSEKQLDFVSAYQVWEYAVKMTGDKLLGLHLGESTNPTILGLIGHLMQSSPTLKDAFENVSKYGVVATDMFRYRISMQSNRYVLQFEPATLWLKQSPDSARHAVEQAMAGTLNVFYLLSGNRTYPAQTNFSFKRPAPLEEYERVFNSSLCYNTESNQLIFEKNQLEKNVLSYDKSLYKVFNAMLKEKRASRKELDKFSERLKKIILTEFNGQVPPIEVLASHMQLTARSLQRKLELEKTTFRAVSTTIKKELAKQFLNNPEVKVGYVASVLGYSEASAFRRAFKSWTNTSPRKIKK